ncbi:MAG: Ig-like domain-containing protein, partial [Anaerolineae bacterium]
MSVFRSSRRVWGLGILALALIICSILLLLIQPLDLLRAPEVVQVLPASGAMDIAPSSPITLTFRNAMDRAATQRAFAISPAVPGTIQWADDRTLVFTPGARMSLSTTVTITLAQTARSWLSRPLERDYVSTFTTLAAPRVLLSDPSLQSHYSYTNKSLTLVFSREMNQASVEAHLLITPTLASRRLQWNGTQLTVAGVFHPGTAYQMVLQGGATDAAYQLGTDRDWGWTFTATNQYPLFAFTTPGCCVVIPAGKPTQVQTQFVNISRIDARLDTLDPNAPWQVLAANRAGAGASRPAGPPLKSWSIDPHAG